jgi:DNA-binding LacI/PurR family transcriptional regulator
VVNINHLPDKSNTSAASQIDVAKLAGVSQAAVSRTFTPGASVAPVTREKVLTAAKTLGYRPNAIARSLITHSTNIIGIVMVRFSNPFYWRVFKEFTKKLQKQGYWTLLFNVADGEQVEETLLTALQYQVDGIIITSATLSSGLVNECLRAGTPVVLFNRYVLGARANAVCCDNVSGGRMVAEALLSAGHRRLAYIAGEEGSSTNQDRKQGFTEGLKEYQNESATVVESFMHRQEGFSERIKEYGVEAPLWESAGQYTYEAGQAAAQRLLTQDNPPDAIFCASDLIAMGAFDQAKQMGIKIPDDLAIVGYDDIDMTAWPNYNLSTVRQPIDRMVDTTIETVMNAINHPESDTVMKWLQPTLIKRGTTR